MNNDLLYQLALTQVPHIGDVRAKTLIEAFGTAEAIFKAPKRKLALLEGIGEVAATTITNFDDFKSFEAEIAFIEKAHIQPLFITDAAYPQRLLNSYDAPPLLFYKGNADLNYNKMIGIVGTRSNSDYGKQICETLIQDLAAHEVCIISGLAFGIDTIAHKAALKNNLKTVGVLAHGLDKIYPAQNKNIAADMLMQGGLLTEFRSGTLPDRHNFPSRNRIVASLCDAIVVIESSEKGGSLITAELANGYNKDVFAFPGKVTDQRSAGCNYLIKQNKAALITNAQDIIDAMNWGKSVPKTTSQRSLFLDLTDDEQKIVTILNEFETIHIDQLYLKTGLSSSSVANALLMLEMQAVITSMPGKMYKLC